MPATRYGDASQAVMVATDGAVHASKPSPLVTSPASSDWPEAALGSPPERGAAADSGAVALAVAVPPPEALVIRAPARIVRTRAWSLP